MTNYYFVRPFVTIGSSCACSCSAPGAAQQRISPTGLGRREEWIGLSLIVEIIFIVAVHVTLIHQGLDVKRGIGVSLAERNVDGGQALAERHAIDLDRARPGGWPDPGVVGRSIRGRRFVPRRLQQALAAAQ